MNEFRDRLLIPFAVPLAAAAVIVFVVFNLSRVLLALEERSGATLATVMAIAGATAVLGAGTWFSSRHQGGLAGPLAVAAAAGVALVAAGSVSFAALDDDEGESGEAKGEEHEPAGTAGGDSQPAGGSEADIVARDIAFEPTQVTVPAGTVTVNLKNEGAILHTLVLEGVAGFTTLETATKGATDSGTADLSPGQYVFYCDQPGHRAAGMEGKITAG